MEAAVPAYRSDATASATAVGELYLYVKQLTTRCSELAEKANSLDDGRIELERQNAELVTRLTSAHTHNDELRARIDELEALRVEEAEYAEVASENCNCR